MAIVPPLEDRDAWHAYRAVARLEEADICPGTPDSDLVEL
jgi:hypothetical protein